MFEIGATVVYVPGLGVGLFLVPTQTNEGC